MSNANSEYQLRIANAELNIQIALLQEKWMEKERTEKKLADSEKRYRRLFESAKDGILILDADTGRVVDANPFLLRLLGYSYGELCGQHIWELGEFKDIAASMDAFKTLQYNEYIRYEDLPLETRNGQPIAVEFVSNVYLVDERKVIQCNIRDITARKRTEKALRESEAKMLSILDAEQWIHQRLQRTGKRNDLQSLPAPARRPGGRFPTEEGGGNPYRSRRNGDGGGR